MTSEMNALLSHAGWLRELALTLVRDPSVADDLVQETWVAALAERSAPVRSSRAFLATVVRRLAWQRLRREGRRKGREEDAARAEATPSTDDLVERMSAHHSVVEAVMELPEHYRAVILRRYFEGEMPQEIARHLDIPISTVKTRLSRGLARLREELDKAFGGDGRAWVSGLAPLLRLPQGSAAIAAAGTGTVAAVRVASNWIPAAVGVSALLTSLGAGWWLFARDPAPVTLTALTPATAPDLVRPAAVGSKGEEGPTRTSAAAPRGSQPEDLMTSLANVARRIQGRVIYPDGSPAPTVLLRFETRDERADGETIALSGSDGTFEMTGAVGRGTVVSGRSDLMTLAAGLVRANETPDDLSVVVAPQRTIAGYVRDERGEPLPGVRVLLDLAGGLGGKAGLALSRAAPFRRVLETDAEGAFAFPDGPEVNDARISFECPGYLPHSRPVDAGPQGDLEIVLAEPAETEGMLTGRVLDPMGREVRGALVSFGESAVRTDGAGMFHLTPPASDELGAEDQRLVALHADFGPGFVTPELRDGEVVWPDPLILTLPAEPASLTGRVVDTEGNGRAGFRVWLLDPTVLTSPPPENGRSRTFHLSGEPGPSDQDLPRVVEALAAGRPYLPWTIVNTDAEGGFTIEGLGPRGYRLGVLDPGTLSVSEFGPFEPNGGAAGEPVELVFQADDLEAVVEGVVVDLSGKPVGGVTVHVRRSVPSVSRNGEAILSNLYSGPRTVTGSDGHFSFRDLPARGTKLELTGPHILQQTFSWDDEGLPEDGLTIVVSKSARLQVLLVDAQEADGFSLLDEAGEPLQVLLVRAGELNGFREAPLFEGRSEVLQAPAEATRLILTLGGEVVREVRLQLEAGQLSRVRL